MSSIIIVSTSQAKRKSYIDAFCKEHAVSQYDTTVITTNEPSLGIAEVRNMQKTVFLKPYNSKEKVVIVEDAQKLTTEAQNALLKVLEEPPLNTYLVLSSSTDSTFLPTILSRCKVTYLKEEKPVLTEEEKKELENALDIMRKGNISARLVLAEKMASQKEALPQWLERIISHLHEMLLANPTDTSIAREITILQETHNILQTSNANVRLVLEHALLTL